MAIAYNPTITRLNNLVLYYDTINPRSFVEDLDLLEYSLYDLSKYGNNPSFYNGAWGTPTSWQYNDQSLAFGQFGSGDVINVPSSSSLNLTNNLSICFWVYVTSAQSGRGVINKGPTGTDYDYMVYLTSNSTAWSLYKKDNAGAAESKGGFTGTYINTWKHIAFTKNGTECKGYENGVLKSTENFTNSQIRTSSNDFRIGYGWNSYFEGYISILQVYNTALNSTEIIQNFSASRKRYGL